MELKAKTGSDVAYRKLHRWVYSCLGKPQDCKICGTNEPRLYHWANISGNYLKKLSDWRSLCVPCHMMEDHIGECPHGHEYKGNSYYITQNGSRICRECKNLSNRKGYIRNGRRTKDNTTNRN